MRPEYLTATSGTPYPVPVASSGTQYPVPTASSGTPYPVAAHGAHIYPVPASTGAPHRPASPISSASGTGYIEVVRLKQKEETPTVTEHVGLTLAFDGDATKPALNRQEGYIGTFAQFSNFKKEDLAQFVFNLEQDHSLGQCTHWLDQFPIDPRYSNRHALQFFFIELAGVFLAFFMLKAVMDITNIETGTSNDYYIAVGVFIFSWTFHLVGLLLIHIGKLRGAAALDIFAICRPSVEDSSEEESEDEATTGLRSPHTPPLLGSKILYKIDPKTGSAVELEDFDEDETDPQNALAFEEQTSKVQILFTCTFVALFAQYFVYLALFAFSYPSFCPSERGPYSCQRMHLPVTYDEAQSGTLEALWLTHYSAPRYATFGNSSYPDVNIKKSDLVPYAMAVPNILWSPKSGKENMAILAHCVPIFFLMYWVAANRLISNLLVRWADEKSGSESLTAVSLKKRYRQALLYLAMVYHTVVPHFSHVMLRFGSLLLDLVDVQDFWQLLIEFDLYEGREIPEPYWSHIGFNLCMNRNNLTNVTCTPETLNCSSASVPLWWRTYQADYNPCKMLIEAAQEWLQGHDEEWLGNARVRENFFAKIGLDFLVSRRIYFYTIFWTYTVSVTIILLWPMFLYFRHGGSRKGSREVGCCRKFLRSGLTGSLADRHKVDNKEALWNAWRTLFLNLSFILCRANASTNLGIIASSLIIKNALLITASSITLGNYFLWAWANPNKWPEVKTSQGCRRFWNRIGWCGIAQIPRWLFLKVIGWTWVKPMLIEIQHESIDIPKLKQCIGKKDSDKYYHEMSWNGQPMLKAGRHYFLLPGHQSPTSYDGTREGRMDRILLGNKNNYMRHDDIMVERHWASNMAGTLS